MKYLFLVLSFFCLFLNFALAAFAEESFHIRGIIHSEGYEKIFASGRRDEIYSIKYNDGYKIYKVNVATRDKEMLLDLEKCRPCTYIDMSIVVEGDGFYYLDSSGIYDAKLNRLWNSKRDGFVLSRIDGVNYLAVKRAKGFEIRPLLGDGGWFIDFIPHSYHFSFLVKDSEVYVYALYQKNAKHYIGKFSSKGEVWSILLSDLSVLRLDPAPSELFLGFYKDEFGVYFRPNGEYDLMFLNDLGEVKFYKKIPNLSFFVMHMSNVFQHEFCLGEKVLVFFGRSSARYDKSMLAIINVDDGKVFVNEDRKTWSAISVPWGRQIYSSGNTGLFEFSRKEDDCNLLTGSKSDQ